MNLTYKLKYSPNARDKLSELKRQITGMYGQETAIKVISRITGGIRGLQDQPRKGVSVEALLGVPTPYRCLHTGRNYVFYRLENDTVYVTDIYDERENFLWKLFRIPLRTQENPDFWGE